VATVLRKGRLHVIPATQLVPGDIVEVAGQQCPAATTLCSAFKLPKMCMQPWHQQEIAGHACITAVRTNMLLKFGRAALMPCCPF